jgi:hypothetical protein
MDGASSCHGRRQPMNLSTHSIPSQAARYSAKSAEAVADSAAPEESNAEFADLFADVAQRSDADGTKKEAPRTEAPAKPHGAKMSSVRPRARTEGEKKTAKQIPDESLVLQVAAPVAQSTEEIEPQGDEMLSEPDAILSERDATMFGSGEKGDVVLKAEVASEDFAPTLPDAGGGAGAVEREDLAAVPPAWKETSPVTKKDAEKNFLADVEDPADVNLSSDLPRAEAEKNGSPLTVVKRGAAKSSGTLDRAAADFADLESEPASAREKPATTFERKILTGADNQVTSREEERGINVAKAAASMNQPASSHQFASLLSKPAATHEVSTPGSFPTQNPPATQGAALSGSHQAVSAAVEAGERLKSGQRAVDLQFSFGSDDLSVRVELHEGRVRATFRTDSAELRGALAHEWQVLNSSSADRAKRFADPVFAANSSSSAAGDHSEKRGARDQNLPASAERFEISNSRSGVAPAAARTVAPATLPQTAVPLTARRLHTFA